MNIRKDELSHHNFAELIMIIRVFLDCHIAQFKNSEASQRYASVIDLFRIMYNYVLMMILKCTLLKNRSIF